MTDATSTVVWDQGYLPFGEPHGGSGSIENSRQYTGKEFEEETGLYYYGARYYHSGLGRFMSVDPAPADPTDPQSWNRYAYVLNNPYKYVDPDGEVPIPILLAAASSFAGLGSQIAGGTADLLVAYGAINTQDSSYIYLKATEESLGNFSFITGLPGLVGSIGSTAANVAKFGRNVRGLTQAASTVSERLINILKPGGKLIGDPGPGKGVQEITGSTDDAFKFFNELTEGGTISSISKTRIETKLPGGSTISFRTKASRSPKTNATIDLKIPGLEELRKIKFNRP
jgi:RHS repeat-associated protein